MKNNIIILKEKHAEIIIDSYKYGIKNILIDLDDIDKVKKIKWHLHYDKCINNFYIMGWDNSRHKHIKLHRYLMNFPKDLVIDHINHDTLDNRKSNLRICTVAENNNNRKNELMKSNKSGYKNISYQKKYKKWIICKFINKKNKTIGRTNTLEEAILLRDNFLKGGLNGKNK